MRILSVLTVLLVSAVPAVALADAPPPIDAGSDTGVADASVSDSGLADAGPGQPFPADASVSDAGKLTPVTDLSACGNDGNLLQGGGVDCSSSAVPIGLGTSGVGLLAFVPLLLRRRRRENPEKR